MGTVGKNLTRKFVFYSFKIEPDRVMWYFGFVLGRKWESVHLYLKRHAYHFSWLTLYDYNLLPVDKAYVGSVSGRNESWPVKVK